MLRLAESYAIAFLLALMVAVSLYHNWRPSGIVVVLYLVVVMLPLTSLYGLADAPATFVYEASVSFVMLLVTIELLPKVRLPRPGRDLLFLGLTAIIGLSAYVYGWLALTGGAERLSFDFSSVYEVRAEYVQTRGPLMGYFVPWQANIVNVMLLCYALYKKNYWLLSLALVLQSMLFGMTGHKSFFLAPLLASGVYFIWKRKNAISYIFLGASLTMLASYAYFGLSGNELIPSIFIRRLFFVPASLHIVYYDFFSQPSHPFYMLSDSVLRYFIKNPYGVHMPQVIAFTYWHREFWPDVGYLGDAYGNFGFLGMVFFSVILGVILRFIDSVGSRLQSNFVAATISMPAYALTESALFTSMLTHGFILSMLMLWLLRSIVKPSENEGNTCTSSLCCKFRVDDQLLMR
ncbi:MAG: hypothetical protein QFX31_07365 [Methanothrix sp.]|uniref:hypothetical protein n=1 Tax=Methanothrix sp. TaxID=90426 RepID=UPI0032AF581D|nr:hypothetical protein [Methanothrix sp.]